VARQSLATELEVVFDGSTEFGNNMEAVETDPAAASLGSAVSLSVFD
jgi:hypothetical protein